MQYTPEINAQIMQLLHRKNTSAVVLDYAGMILDVFAESYDNGEALELNIENALNGAKSWTDASFRGSYLVYTTDLAEIFGAEESDSEKLLNMQADALAEAWNEIQKAVKFINGCQQYNVNF
jgi:hypothetical protein